MNGPSDAAVEAAAKATCRPWCAELDEIPGVTAGFPCRTCKDEAHAALSAALPIIRQELAAEIVSGGPKHPFVPNERTRINAWSTGLHAAARIVRGEFA